MANLTVTPDYLEKLAKKQDDAVTEAGGAAGAASGTGTSCWINHGVISGASNSSISTAEDSRAAAGKTISQACSDLAAKLRVARQAYASVDAELGGNLDKQVLSK
ncbi:ESX-1 secretion-associated protein [Mycolicibacterium sp. S2-37]|uniref:ESX-1 secretion-associated protein n=1 Tax=Mycolicibacterium sp. S2-37 TaxID=2810297 RepID=UPI001A93F86F|nr:ESX-1 secretion-associated protein [Mycolicibacterium sp. S2-37]MBO0677341.1 ESX-1 secretion-associated protein [Mycolicibacterium sp. S2-37]